MASYMSGKQVRMEECQIPWTWSISTTDVDNQNADSEEYEGQVPPQDGENGWTQEKIDAAMAMIAEQRWQHLAKDSNSLVSQGSYVTDC